MARLTLNGIVTSLVLAAILASSLSAPASFRRGNDLVKYMREYEKADRDEKTADFTHAADYVAFVIGVSDSLDEKSFCLPEGSTVGQVCAVVAKYLNAHPEEWEKPGYILVAKALKQAFPCKGVTRR